MIEVTLERPREELEKELIQLRRAQADTIHLLASIAKKYGDPDIRIHERDMITSETWHLESFKDDSTNEMVFRFRSA